MVDLESSLFFILSTENCTSSYVLSNHIQGGRKMMLGGGDTMVGGGLTPYQGLELITHEN